MLMRDACLLSIAYTVHLWSRDKSSAPVGNQTQAVQPIARRYKD
jgi:hypothetical protein